MKIEVDNDPAEILEALQDKWDKVKGGEKCSDYINEEQWFEYVWNNNDDPLIREFVKQNRPPEVTPLRKLLFRNGEKTSSDPTIELNNFKRIYEDAKKSGRWRVYHYNELIECIWALSDNFKLVEKFWRVIEQKVPKPIKVWGSVANDRFAKRMTNQEFFDFQMEMKELRNKLIKPKKIHLPDEQKKILQALLKDKHCELNLNDYSVENLQEIISFNKQVYPPHKMYKEINIRLIRHLNDLIEGETNE